MTKAEAINRTAIETMRDKAQTASIIANLMASIMDALGRGEAVFIPGFGTFHPQWHNETTGRLIRQNKPLIVPAHYVPHFRPYQDFKDLVKTTTGIPFRKTNHTKSS